MPRIPSPITSIDILRQDRFIICHFRQAFQVLSTCSINGGIRHDLKAILNHQSCEGRAHLERAHRIVEVGPKGYHSETCSECGLPPETTACMGTAANMQYAVSKIENWEDLFVQAIVTAGVTGNALRAGDPAKYHEFENNWKPVAAIPGTINTMLLVSHPLSPAALARTVVTMTEAKSAVLQDLCVGSLGSRRLATGTGTDQYAIACPIDATRASYTWSGGHTRLGELMGRAVVSATKEALLWQNGLHPELMRNCFHLLGRFGLKKEIFKDHILARYCESEAAFLLQNELAICHDPEVTTACLSLASLIDAFENGLLPEPLFHSKLLHQLALMATTLSGKLDRFSNFHQELQIHSHWMEAFIHAVGLGFQYKWKNN